MAKLGKTANTRPEHISWCLLRWRSVVAFFRVLGYASATRTRTGRFRLADIHLITYVSLSSMTAESSHAPPDYDRLHHRSMTSPDSLQNSLPICDGAWEYMTMHTAVRTTFTTPVKHGFRRFSQRRCSRFGLNQKFRQVSAHRAINSSKCVAHIHHIHHILSISWFRFVFLFV